MAVIVSAFACSITYAEARHTICIASPTINTTVWSAIVAGEARKNHASVIWNKESEVIMVEADIRGILIILAFVKLKAEKAKKIFEIKLHRLKVSPARFRGSLKFHPAISHSTSRATT